MRDADDAEPGYAVSSKNSLPLEIMDKNKQTVELFRRWLQSARRLLHSDKAQHVPNEADDRSDRKQKAEAVRAMTDVEIGVFDQP